MKETLVKRFGFDPNNIELLTDAPDSCSSLPTGANIKQALTNMVDGAEAGDVLFFHYSGHGTRIPSKKRAHPFRHEEAIVPCDFNLITDLDLRELVNKLPKGASLTIFSDSCHSGGLIDKEKEQIGPSSMVHQNTTLRGSDITPKTIPYDSILHHLSSLSKVNTTDMGSHLVELFGSEASLRFRLPLVDLDLLEQVMRPDEGILLSGCQADETSADMNEGGGRAYGAFSNAVQRVLEENPGRVSNAELVIMARKMLQSGGFEQHPCLYCSDDNARAAFLCQEQ
uniref:Metacaspase-9 n=2 Tax=Cajanus cajan TaxID=3821 RepID=A0A151TAD9_CAJCA|nr:Metacaspase-9 [Cajanus cajan]